MRRRWFTHVLPPARWSRLTRPPVSPGGSGSAGSGTAAASSRRRDLRPERLPRGRGRARPGCRSRSTAAACPARRAGGTGARRAAEHPRIGIGPRDVGRDRAQRRRAPDARAGTGPGRFVDDEDPVLGQPRAQLADQPRGQERQVTARTRRRPVGTNARPAREGGDGAAARGVLPDHTNPGRDRLRWADDDPRLGVGDGRQHRGQHRAAADLQLGLGLAAEPGCPAAGQDDGGKGSNEVHAYTVDGPTVGTVPRGTSDQPDAGAAHPWRGAHHAAGHRGGGGAAGDPAGRLAARGHHAHARATTSTWSTGSSPPRGSSAPPTTRRPALLRFGRRRGPQHLQRRRRRPGARCPDARHRTRPQLLHIQLLRGVRQGQHRRDPDEDPGSTWLPTNSRCRSTCCSPCPTSCVPPSRSSTRPEACTRRVCSPRRVTSWPCARDSGSSGSPSRDRTCAGRRGRARGGAARGRRRPAPTSSSPPAGRGSPPPTSRRRPPGGSSSARHPGIAEAIRRYGAENGVPTSVLSRGAGRHRRPHADRQPARLDRRRPRRPGGARPAAPPRRQPAPRRRPRGLMESVGQDPLRGGCRRCSRRRGGSRPA